ncbi:MAG TPA: hypothetical protein VHE32_01030 [Rhodanobacteraceae bacterium]|nr:hypothetical protein [Rhodanobacteraceae bacterium]
MLTDRAGFGNALEVEVDSDGVASGGTSVTCVEGTLRFRSARRLDTARASGDPSAMRGKLR